MSLFLSRDSLLLFSVEFLPTIESILNVNFGFDVVVDEVVAAVMWPIDGNDICGAKGIIAQCFASLLNDTLMKSIIKNVSKTWTTLKDHS